MALLKATQPLNPLARPHQRERISSGAAALTAPVFYVRFPPTWEHIEPVRQYMDSTTRLQGLSGISDRIGIVVQELLENAVKYGDPTSEIELSLHRDRTSRSVDVRVINKAHRSRISILEKEFQRTRGDTAREAFSRALERLQKMPEGASMLGLSRIALDSTLSLAIEGDRVVMTARVG